MSDRRKNRWFAVALGFSVLGFAADVSALGVPFFPAFERLPVAETERTLEECYERMVPGEDGMEPDTEACAETIADAFQEDFEDTFGRSGAPDGVGVRVDQDGTIEAVSGTYESGFDAQNTRFDSLIANQTIVDLFVANEGFLNHDDNINTCHEYAIARNWDYFQFRQHTDAVDSAMELFELGMTESGGDVVNRLADGELLRNRAYHGLASEDSRCSGSARCLRAADQPQEPFAEYLRHEGASSSAGARIVRNTFHILNGTELYELRRRAPALAEQLEQSMVQSYPDTWDEHRTRYEELADEDPEVLEAHSAARQRFVSLIMQRRAAQEQLVASRGSYIVRAQLSALDDAIAEAIETADANGCIGDISGHTMPGEFQPILSPTAPTLSPRYTACDWAPNDFIAQFVAQAEANTAQRMEECMTSSINARSGGIAIYADADAGNRFYYDTCSSNRIRQRSLSARNFTDETRVESAIRAVASAEERVLDCLIESDASTRLRLNYADGKSATFGDADWFEAGYLWSYDVGVADTDDGQLCNINPHAEAEVRAFYEIMGTGRNDIAAAEVDLNLRRGSKVVDLMVGPMDLVDLEGETAGGDMEVYSFVWAPNDLSVSEEFELADLTFSIPGVPANVSIGATAEVGIDGNIKATFGERESRENSEGESCSVVAGTLDAGARPYAAAEAHVSAAIGFDKWGVTLEGGIQANVKLVEASLPVDVSAEIVMAQDFSDIALDLSMNMDFEIDNLDGSVVAYAEAAIGRWEKRWEKELFSFTGFSTTIPLIDVEANYSVEVWEGICSVADCTE